LQQKLQPLIFIKTNSESVSKDIGNRDFYWWMHDLMIFEENKEDGSALQFVKEQTPEICMKAVKQNGLALQFFKEQTPEICVEAVKQNGLALKHVKEQTPKICVEAVKQDILALEYINDEFNYLFNN
jgi:hypothetical protein